MSISIVEPPNHKATGRQPRLSEEDQRDLAKTVKSGHWASDQEPVITRSAAYQRAQSARDLVATLLPDSYKVEQIKTAVEALPVTDLTKPQIEVLNKDKGKPRTIKGVTTTIQEVSKTHVTVLSKNEGTGQEETITLTEVYTWKIGPRPEGERPRSRPTQKNGTSQQA